MEVIIIISLIGVIITIILCTSFIIIKLSAIKGVNGNDMVMISQRLDTSTKIAFELNSKLSTLEEANKKIFEVGKDISSLQEILQTPKIRGTLGELFLGDLLSQMLPKNRFHLQYQFKTGNIVDAAVIFPSDLLVCIDSKFPLENFRKLLDSSLTTIEKDRMRKIFLSDVKKHIDAISSKYILSDENTTDFALMYIPAENVYYEMIIKDESSILEYSFAKRVIPVSPNTLNIYLQTIIMGLRGLQIEQSAKEIMKELLSLRTTMQGIETHFDTLGKHLNNARSQYDETYRDLNKLGLKLTNIETKE